MIIDNLVFFNSKGLQIPIQSNHKVTFTIIGNQFEIDHKYGWESDTHGYISFNNRNEVTSMTITNIGQSFGFNDKNSHQKVVKSLINEVLIKINDDSNPIEFSLSPSDFNITIKSRFESTGGDELQVYYIDNISIKDPDLIFMHLVDNNQLDVSLYPSTIYLSSLNMESVSTELVSTETIFILEKNLDKDGNTIYIRPRSHSQNLRFEFPEKSDIKFIKDADEWKAEDIKLSLDSSNIDYSKAYWSSYKAFDLVSEYNNENYHADEPLIMTLGFSADTEGCYQDILTILSIDGLDNAIPKEKINPIGYIAVKAEAIGEDERYRTLFTNFGLPDPKDYQNVFKDSDILEEGQDWEFINKKSKQLFLSYPQIFPYIGTYKALINTVKFLGYNDVYFKEWYEFFDGKDATELSYKSIDIVSGQTLQSKLERINVSLDDFIKWKKLNKLSLIYKINEEQDNNEVVTYYTNGNPYELQSGQMHLQSFDIHQIKKNYTYYNSEVLAKLYSLKKWLEKYILNINCQIIDITGEGVYIEKQKESVSTVGYYTFSEDVENSITPIFDSSNLLDSIDQNSSVEIPCSLKEIKNNLKLESQKNSKFKDYISLGQDKDTKEYIKDAKEYENIDNLDSISGNNYNTPLKLDTIQYELHTDVSSGSLSNNIIDQNNNENSLIVKDNEIYSFKDINKDVIFEVPPIIYIENGNLRKTFGKWNNNIEYSIKTFFSEDSHSNMIGIFSKDFYEKSHDYIALYPRYIIENGVRKCISTFKYTKNNKYHTPLFILENYDTYDKFLYKDHLTKLKNKFLEEAKNVSEKQKNKIIENSSKEANNYKQKYFSENIHEKYILDIKDGFILNKEISESKNVNCYAKLIFDQQWSDMHEKNEQDIHIEYSYITDALSTIGFDIDSFNKKCLEINDSKLLETNKINEFYKNLLLEITQDKDFKGNISNSIEYSNYCNQYQSKIKNIQKTINDLNIKKSEIENLDIINIPKEFILNYKTQIDSLNKKINLYNKLLKSLKEEISIYKQSIINKYSIEKENTLKNIEIEYIKKIYDLKSEFNRINDKFDIKVNHAGKYYLIGKGTNCYNELFVGRSNTDYEIVAKKPKFDILTPQVKDNIINLDNLKIDLKPEFWPTSFVSINQVNPNNSSLSYNNLSYINDTPKENDILNFVNVTERVENIDKENVIIIDDKTKQKHEISKVTVILNDENPEHENLFYKNGSFYLVFLNSSTHMLLDNNSIIGPFEIESFKPIPIDDKEEKDNNQIVSILNSQQISSSIISYDDKIEKLKNLECDCYAIANNQLEIKYENIENNFNNRTSIIRIKDTKNYKNLAFKTNNVIKLLFSEITYNGKDSLENDLFAENYIGGTSYRIIDSYYDVDSYEQVYVLNGLVNKNLLQKKYYKNGIYNDFNDINIPIGIPYEVKCIMSNAHNTYVFYNSSSIDNTYEHNDIGEFRFKDNWNGFNFIDPTFSMSVRKFNIYDAIETYTSNYNNEMYMNNKAIVNDNIILKSKKDSSEIWNVWNIYENKNLIYQYTNDNLSLKTKNEGKYRLTLETIDKFGNDSISDNEYLIVNILA